MPALQVKDFPEDLYVELKACAAKEDRSLSQQVTHILREYLENRRDAQNSVANMFGPEVQLQWVLSEIAKENTTMGSLLREPAIAEEIAGRFRAERRRRLLEEIANDPLPDIPDDFPSPAEMIRKDRERRTEQILANVEWGSAK